MTAAVIAMTDADYTPRYTVDHISGGLVHDYLKRELADPSWEWLIPRCQDSRMYPDRHPRIEMRMPLDTDPVCKACASFRPHHQNEGPA